MGAWYRRRQGQRVTQSLAQPQHLWAQSLPRKQGTSGRRVVDDFSARMGLPALCSHVSLCNIAILCNIIAFTSSIIQTQPWVVMKHKVQRSSILGRSQDSSRSQWYR